MRKEPPSTEDNIYNSSYIWFGDLKIRGDVLYKLKHRWMLDLHDDNAAWLALKEVLKEKPHKALSSEAHTVYDKGMRRVVVDSRNKEIIKATIMPKAEHLRKKVRRDMKRRSRRGREL